ncbi:MULTISPECIES: DUF7112 family protein [Saliphagus]|uniref:Uncharacterized protein n=1 Tax=Saliphagus infecundisoli TaxID=1849069 RepID=A0ABD5QKJ1_9EURY|nr:MULTISPECIES: hypothetical protein [Saliphagus]
MADRLASDHPSIETVRATLAETPTGVRIDVPAEEADRLPVGEVVRVACNGDELFARPDRTLGGDGVRIPGLYDAPGYARDPGGCEDRLAGWVAEGDARPGGSVLLDIVEPDFLYGIRAPGETAYYEAREPPADSLSAIAEDLED